MRLTGLIAKLPRATPGVLRALGIATVATQAGIGVTGSVVRVTGSGLGCSTWPQCHAGSMVPVAHPEYETLNQWIEFGNRMLTGVVGLVAIACVLAAWRLKLATDRRRPLTYALAVLIGTGMQGVIGGITVRMELLWWTVAVHFVASAVLVWVSVLLLHAFGEGDAPPRWLHGTRGRTQLIALVAVLAAVIVAGTTVTGAGPHGGDPATPRFDAPIDVLTAIHGGLLVTLLVVLAVIGLSLVGRDAPRRFTRRYVVLWVVVLAQGALGSAQYQLGVPESLVSLHVLGSALVLIATAALWCAARERAAVSADDVADGAGKPLSGAVAHAQPE